MQQEEVIKVLNKYANDYLTAKEDYPAFDYAIECVKERKTGRWIIGNYGFICSLCGTEERKNHFPKYCPECGAKMEGAEK